MVSLPFHRVLLEELLLLMQVLPTVEVVMEVLVVLVMMLHLEELVEVVLEDILQQEEQVDFIMDLDLLALVVEVEVDP